MRALLDASVLIGETLLVPSTLLTHDVADLEIVSDLVDVRRP